MEQVLFIGMSLILNEYSIEAGIRADGQERERWDKPGPASEAFPHARRMKDA